MKMLYDLVFYHLELGHGLSVDLRGFVDPLAKTNAVRVIAVRGGS